MKDAFACLSEMAQIVVFLWTCAHSHTNTHRNTPLHHPPMHSDNDTDPKHNNHVNFRTHLDQSRNCLFRLLRAWMRSIESVFGGSSWSSLDLETLESDVSSGKSAGAIAEDRAWPSSVRQLAAAIKRGGPSPRYVGGVERRLTPELLDEIPEFIEEEYGRIPVKTVSIRFTLC